MTKYMVAITEIVEYLVPVEAPNEERAGEIAEQLITDSADRDKWCCDVRAREIEGVELSTQPAVAN